MFVAVSKKDVQEGKGFGFCIQTQTGEFRGFVVLWKGEYLAYQNECQHLPVTLDLDDNHFFNHEGNLLQCHMHGALFEVDGGLCIDGPCEGQRLVPLAFVDVGEALKITIPDVSESE